MQRVAVVAAVLVLAHVAGAQVTMQPRTAGLPTHTVSTSPAPRQTGPIATTTLGNTPVLKADITSRVGQGQVLKNQQQASVQAGSTKDIVNIIDQTRIVNRASASTRTALGNNAAQAAVQSAMRGGNAAGAANAGSAVTQLAAQGGGVNIRSAATRASAAQQTASAQIQAAARGQAPVALTTGAVQDSATAVQARTSQFNNQVGRR